MTKKLINNLLIEVVLSFILVQRYASHNAIQRVSRSIKQIQLSADARATEQSMKRERLLSYIYMYIYPRSWVGLCT